MTLRSTVRIVVGFSWIALLSTLQGCASTSEITREAQQLVQEQIAELQAAPECCGSVADIEYASLGPTLSRHTISSDKARLFDAGKSHFLAAVAPTIASRQYLLVKSHTVQWRRHGLPYIFSPSILAFDDQFHPSGKWLDIPLCYSQGWSKLETGYFGAVRLNPEAHKRLLFFTTEAALERSTHFGNSATGAGIGYAVTVNTQYDFPHSPVGELEIGVMPPDLEKYLRARCPMLFEESSAE